jgi:hypothetical protein
MQSSGGLASRVRCSADLLSIYSIFMTVSVAATPVPLCKQGNKAQPVIVNTSTFTNIWRWRGLTPPLASMKQATWYSCRSTDYSEAFYRIWIANLLLFLPLRKTGKCKKAHDPHFADITSSDFPGSTSRWVWYEMPIPHVRRQNWSKPPGPYPRVTMQDMRRWVQRWQCTEDGVFTQDQVSIVDSQ